jgi:hypothetical protein
MKQSRRAKRMARHHHRKRRRASLNPASPMDIFIIPASYTHMKLLTTPYA